MKNVWVVDDDEEMGRAVSLMLRLLDFEPQHFHDPRRATQSLLAGGDPDLLLLDINMPEVSGLDVLEFLRRHKDWKRLPIVMLTSEAADITVDKALRLGADAYVTKPVTIDELERAISEAFSKH